MDQNIPARLPPPPSAHVLHRSYSLLLSPVSCHVRVARVFIPICKIWEAREGRALPKAYLIKVDSLEKFRRLVYHRRQSLSRQILFASSSTVTQYHLRLHIPRDRVLLTFSKQAHSGNMTPIKLHGISPGIFEYYARYEKGESLRMALKYLCFCDRECQTTLLIIGTGRVNIAIPFLRATFNIMT